MKSDEAFMLELQPHVERTVQKICSALGKQGDATAAQDVAKLLKEEASHAIKVLAEKGRLMGGRSKRAHCTGRESYGRRPRLPTK